MATPRSLVIEDARPWTFHLISHCVRRGFLCGDAADHRRAWLEQSIKSQVQAFDIDVLTFVGKVRTLISFPKHELRTVIFW